MRCLSCQRQSFQSWSGTEAQKPRPAGRNCLREWSGVHKGGSSPVAQDVSFIVGELYFSTPTCQATARKGSRNLLSAAGQRIWVRRLRRAEGGANLVEIVQFLDHFM